MSRTRQVHQNPDDLQGRRKATGLTQEQLAHRAECSTAMLALLERGYRPVKSATLERIVAILEDEERQAA